MNRISRLLLMPCVLAAALASSAGEVSAKPKQSPEVALQAKHMLSPNRWAEAIRIRNTSRTSRFPDTVYATVFELNDSLWFYTATGTQELRRSRGRTEAFKKDLLPLLRGVDKGFASYESLGAPSSDPVNELPRLINGCVVESIYVLEEMAGQGEAVHKAQLLLYSSTKNKRRGRRGNATGHAVLVYETGDGIFFVDPPELDVVGSLTASGWDPADMATEIESAYGDINIEEAFFIPFPVQRGELADAGM